MGSHGRRLVRRGKPESRHLEDCHAATAASSGSAASNSPGLGDGGLPATAAHQGLVEKASHCRSAHDIRKPVTLSLDLAHSGEADLPVDLHQRRGRAAELQDTQSQTARCNRR